MTVSTPSTRTRIQTTLTLVEILAVRIILIAISRPQATRRVDTHGVVIVELTALVISSVAVSAPLACSIGVIETKLFGVLTTTCLHIIA